MELVKQVNLRCSANEDVMKIQLTQIEENLTNLKEGQVRHWEIELTNIQNLADVIYNV